MTRFDDVRRGPIDGRRAVTFSNGPVSIVSGTLIGIRETKTTKHRCRSGSRERNLSETGP